MKKSSKPASDKDQSKDFADESTKANVKVAVRVRPFSKREIEERSRLVIDMRAHKTKITDPTFFEADPLSGLSMEDRLSGKDLEEQKDAMTKSFNFDHSLWSHRQEDPNFVTQQAVYKELGEPTIHNALQGYHCSIFAYGQTG
jgi:hypothetical protein